MLTITLPIPDSSAAINKTKGRHWSVIASKRKIHRQEGYMLAYQAYQQQAFTFAKDEELLLIINVFHRNKKHLDDDNLLSALKSYRDGVFDFLEQKFGVNDKQITLTILNTTNFDKLNSRVEWSLQNRQEWTLKGIKIDL